MTPLELRPVPYGPRSRTRGSSTPPPTSQFQFQFISGHLI